MFFVESLHWLRIFGWEAWAASALFQATFPAVWGVVAHPFLAETRFSVLSVLFPPLSYTAMEALRNLGSFGMPWGDLAYSQWKFLPVIQLVSLTGALGLTFAVVLFNTLIFWGLKTRNWKHFLMGGLCFFSLLLFGLFRHELPSGVSAKIALIQTNDQQMLKWDPHHYWLMVQEMDRLIQDAKKEKPELILFPETALAGFLSEDAGLQALVIRWARETGSTIAVGTLNLKEGKPQNQMVLIKPDGSVGGEYSKIKLVPFGEYLPYLFRPFRGHWHLLDPIVDYKPGNEFTIFHLNEKAFGSMICFESSFGWMARALVLRGAEFLTVSTNDAWFFGTPAQEEHAAMAVFRSVETGRSCIQAGNTGVSLATDPEGRILAWANPNQAKEIFSIIPLTNTLTLYDRIGDCFPYLTMIASLAILVGRWAMTKRTLPIFGPVQA